MFKIREWPNLNVQDTKLFWVSGKLTLCLLSRIDNNTLHDIDQIILLQKELVQSMNLWQQTKFIKDPRLVEQTQYPIRPEPIKARLPNIRCGPLKSLYLVHSLLGFRFTEDIRDDDVPIFEHREDVCSGRRVVGERVAAGIVEGLNIDFGHVCYRSSVVLVVAKDVVPVVVIRGRTLSF